jgi:hypothetical protein
MSLQVRIQAPDPHVLDARPPTVRLSFSEDAQVAAAHPVNGLLHESHTGGRTGNHVLEERIVPLNGVELPGRIAVAGVLEDGGEMKPSRSSRFTRTLVSTNHTVGTLVNSQKVEDLSRVSG